MGKHQPVLKGVNPRQTTEDDDEWRPLKYLKITKRPTAPTTRDTVEYNPYTSVQMEGLEDWITHQLALVTFEGNYVNEAIAIHHTDGCVTVWKRA